VSVFWTNSVWTHSRVSGAALLVLLALADHAQDETGEAWPSIAHLSRKTRMNQRRVQRCLRRLEQLGEIRTVPRSGHSSMYFMQVGSDDARRGDVVTAPRNVTPDEDAGGGGDTDAGGGVTMVPPRIISETSSETSRTRPTKRAVGAATIREAQVEAMVSAYNRLCPSLPRLRDMTFKRSTKIRTRLREHPLEWWEDVFVRTERSAFLTGGGDRGWRASLDWLIRNDTQAVEVLEGKYDDPDQAADEPPYSSY